TCALPISSGAAGTLDAPPLPVAAEVTESVPPDAELCVVPDVPPEPVAAVAVSPIAPPLDVSTEPSSPASPACPAHVPPAPPAVNPPSSSPSDSPPLRVLFPEQATAAAQMPATTVHHRRDRANLPTRTVQPITLIPNLDPRLLN